MSRSELLEKPGLILACAAGVGFSIATVPPFVLSVFATPMTQGLGWSLQEYQTGGFLIALGIWIGAPLGGALVDRFGARRAALLGIPTYCLSIAAFSLVTNALWTYYAAMFATALLSAGTLPITWTKIVNANFTRQRGLALGIVLSGSGVFAIFGPSLAQALIEQWGWRGAWRFLAALPLVFALPLVWRFVQTDGSATNESDAADDLSYSSSKDGTQDDASITLKRALSSRPFWTLAIAFGFVSFGLGGWNANLVPILLENGLDTSTAVKIAGILGIAMAVGRLVAGALLDRFWAPGVVAIAFILPPIGAALLLTLNPGIIIVGVAVACFGLAHGAEFDFLAYLTVKYFGLNSYGKIYGILLLPISFSTSLGAVLFGRAKDVTGSFQSGLITCMVLFLIATILALTLGRRNPSRTNASGPGTEVQAR